MLITSRQNPIVARYRSAARGEDRTVMLLDGVHLVADALAAGLRVREAAVAAEAETREDVATVLAALRSARVNPVRVSAPVMAAISPVRSPSPIAALADRPPGDPARVYASAAPLVLIAVGVQEPGNFGAIARAAEAAGASGVVAAGNGVDPFGWKALRGSMGSALRLPIGILEAVDAAIASAREHGCRVLATAPRGGRSLFDCDLRGGTAVLIGGEGSGLPASAAQSADECVTIPMQPPVESLNAAVTASVIAYEARRQRTRKNFDGHEGGTHATPQ